MKKWIFSIFCWVIALYDVIAVGVFFAFYDETDLLIYGSLSAGFWLALLIFTIGIANMPEKGEKK